MTNNYNLEEKTAALKKYFQNRDDIIMAFLFGSRARNKEITGSDWDIAIYFKSLGKSLEWEDDEREYPEEEQVWNDCIDILQNDNVDLIILNRAPAHLADIGIKGKPIIIKDRNLWLRFMLTITREAADYRQTVNEYYIINQRSQSLNTQDQKNL
ncbi:nucleotidyltransferase domain-containing protein [Patescibacteria group bacterium]|nr:nucleotidyltransferase domain-containing protein [Patescibacteria group bacterium]